MNLSSIHHNNKEAKFEMRTKAVCPLSSVMQRLDIIVYFRIFTKDLQEGILWCGMWIKSSSSSPLEGKAYPNRDISSRKNYSFSLILSMLYFLEMIHGAVVYYLQTREKIQQGESTLEVGGL